MADTKKVILKWTLSGGYYDHEVEEGAGSVHHDYPPALEPASLPSNVADSLVESGNAWTPAQWAKVRNKRG